MIRSLIRGKLNIIIFTISVIFFVLAILCLYLTTNANNSKVKATEINNIGLSKVNKDLKQELRKLTQEIDDLKLKGSALEKENLDMKRENFEKDSGSKDMSRTGNNYMENQNVNANISSSVQKLAYLTFDDGPSINTRRILKILMDNEIKGTFFVNGNENLLEVYRSILADGHVIGNHTYSHDYKKIYTSVYDFIKDFEKLNTLLEKIDGYKTEIYRFPGGSKNGASERYGGKGIMDKIELAMREKGYKYFDWNVTSADSDPGPLGKDPKILANNILKGAYSKKTAMILMHDRSDRDATLEALPQIIEGLKQQGFEFGVLTKDFTY